MADEQPRKLSRRELLKGAGMAGAAAVLPRSLVAEPAPASSAPAAAAEPGQQLVQLRPIRRYRRRVYENLTAEEARTLEVIMNHLIPTDEHGPGAVEAGALTYLDKALGGALAGEREAYRIGLEALDRYSRYSRGARFVDLSENDQLSVLIDLEGGSATGSGAGFDGSSGAFFGMLKGHTWQGMFGDPYYGGNIDYEGWKLIRYPGVRTVVTAEDQRRLEAGTLPPNYQSAYDYPLFEKATVQADSHHGGTHAD